MICNYDNEKSKEQIRFSKRKLEKNWNKSEIRLQIDNEISL